MHCLLDRDEDINSCDLYYFRSEEFTGISFDDPPDNIPQAKQISAYPNPFNSTVNIYYENPEGGDLWLEIFNLKGQLVKSFASINEKSGYITWDGTSNEGAEVTSGIYFIKNSTPTRLNPLKLIYLK